MSEDLDRLLDVVEDVRAQIEAQAMNDGEGMTHLPGTPGAVLMEKLLGVQAQLMNLPAMNRVRCFMVDISGKDPIEVGQAEVSVAGVAGIMERAGSLAANVKALLDAGNYSVTDSGGGVVGWHYGAHCTPGEAWHLAKLLRKTFRKAIDANLITVTIKPWSIGKGPA